MTTVSVNHADPVFDANQLAEVADNTYRDAEADLNNTEASFIGDGGVSTDQRKMNAVRAYFEWMPLRYNCSTSMLHASR
jgi:phosphodiesterase/alkaline phosphatase D-like protein